MQTDQKRENILEWACRILLTLHAVRAFSGYFIYWQNKWQLKSPLIPSYFAEQISEPYLKAGMITTLVFLLALWLYFFRKKVAVLIVSGLSLILFEWLLFYSASK
jgi:hypothetical protein